ncbi:MAG: UDP-N-acetylmuramoyl-L-alanine--D-glutamate ligase [Candidatus Pacebacteria bacterium]|nr:UDP-N-acetylmuramoyl-L-alanine--D-glutamate ligase [Candidatus Paceibacterota bacterium]
MLIEELRSKKIIVLGFGEEGKDNYLALRKLFPEQVLAVADRKRLDDFAVGEQKILKTDRKIRLHLGPDYLKALRDYEVIIKTPGIPSSALKPFLAKGSRVITQTEIFFANFQGKIIGVTGTKGKGTTSALIFNILQIAGFDTKLVGNIGQPVFQLLLRAKPNQIFVYELSSHQLQNLRFSPWVAVFLNIFPDHLEYYKNFQNYQKAKESITAHQSSNDFLIYNSDDKVVREIAQKSRVQKIAFNKKTTNQVLRIIQRKDIPLRGDFNLMNIAAAYLVAKILGVGESLIKKGIRSFRPLPHRLEFAGRYRGIEFYDDSMATVPQTTEVDIKALGPRLTTIMLGGSSKGEIDFSSLAMKVVQSHIKTVILFPDTGQAIWRAIERASKIRKKRPPQSFPALSMQEAIEIAYQQTNKGELCLLAPASASFSLFRDYKERGDLFKKYAQRLGQKK